MILPAVSELLSGVRGDGAVEGVIGECGESSAAEAALTGLTDTAKTLLAAHAVSALRRPIIFLTVSNQRAEALLEPLRYFCRALAGPSVQVTMLPAFDVLPWQGVSPHPEILESRAATLWRVSRGTANLLVVPLAAALFSVHDTRYYTVLGRTLEPDAEAAFDELLSHLTAVGYERGETAEIAGQFAGA